MPQGILHCASISGNLLPWYIITKDNAAIRQLLTLGDGLLSLHVERYKAAPPLDHGAWAPGRLEARLRSGWWWAVYKVGPKATWNSYAQESYPCSRAIRLCEQDPMVERDNSGKDLDPGTWPFPTGPWVVALFWLLVVALAVTAWVFAWRLLAPAAIGSAPETPPIGRAEPIENRDARCTGRRGPLSPAPSREYRESAEQSPRFQGTPCCRTVRVPGVHARSRFAAASSTTAAGMK